MKYVFVEESWEDYLNHEIMKEHRLVYRVKGEEILIAKHRFHYD